MKEIQDLYTEAARYKTKRAALASKLAASEPEYRKKKEALEADHLSRRKNIEDERRAAEAAIQRAAQGEIADLAKTKSDLSTYVDPVRKWCPQDRLRAYQPNPGRVDQQELERLIRMVREEGIIAWFKRTFKLGGYASREVMALELCQKIEDACAFCNERIWAVEMDRDRKLQAQATASRRKLSGENDRYEARREELEDQQRKDQEAAREAIRRFDTAAELKALRSQIAKMSQAAADACGKWGVYSAPDKMPDRVQLCDLTIPLLNEHGAETPLALPLWLDLYKSNIIVVTSESGASAGADCLEKEFVRKLLARMLKTIPPEYCSYSIFDALHKGASLERLVDVTNVGTTDLNFDLFTSNDNDGEGVSCGERRKYLRSRPAEIIKFIAGRSKSLFEHNRKLGEFSYPFNWVVDFHFPEAPEGRFLEDMKELLVNADAAGYSFVFVTSEKGLAKVRELAEAYTKTPVVHVDCSRMTCSKGELSFPFRKETAPGREQIYNFMTALDRYYEDGGAIDNRINAVFAAKGIVQRDASEKLTIPMALDSRGELVDLSLGGEGSVHGFISGGTNSGKSTLLHTIILSACLHYHPEDLEIWLVDYKQTEFHLYKKRTPPHIKLIGVSKTADFTYSLLDKIEEEANRRTDLMNRFDVQNLADYRKHQGEPGYVNIPRLFIVIDEFHEMSQFVAAEREYQDKLENILREYRAQGLTCLLADQTFSSGLSGLTPAAKNQIGLRIAMRNEASPQELKATLEVDRALYSDSMQHTIAVMSQGEFIMKVYVRDKQGKLTDIRLEKFKGLYTKGDDIAPVGRALRQRYKGQFRKDLIYVNTKERVRWDDAEMEALDRAEPLRYPNMRLYLGRSATLRPCFGLDLGRQPNENMSIVGGTALQRWELLAAMMRSCYYRQYKLVVFMAEYSDLMSDHAQQIRQLCGAIPGAELVEQMEDWCAKLKELEAMVANRQNQEDILCIFLGLEIASIEFARLPEENAGGSLGGFGSGSFLEQMSRLGGLSADVPAPEPPKPAAFNALPLIDRLFSSGARSGIRCAAEVSVYRQFAKLLKLKDMCRHKVAFSMSAEDCLMYLGNSSFQKSIGQNAIYTDGSKEVKKLLPYLLTELEESL